MASKLRDRAVGLIDDRILVLPPRVELDAEQRFETRLCARFGARPPRWRNRCVWIARIEPFKGTDILLEIAHRRPDLAVDMFGSASDEMRRLLATRPNLHYRGEFSRLDDLDLESYGCLLFPSLFEGMPNAVLEAAQAGLPVISSDVGGLRQTFDAQQVCLVKLGADSAESAARFIAAIDELQSTADGKLEVRLRAARAAVIAKHGQSAFTAGVNEILRAGKLCL